MAKSINPNGSLLNIGVIAILCAVADFTKAHPEHKEELGNAIHKYSTTLLDGKAAKTSLPAPFGKLVNELVKNDARLSRLAEYDEAMGFEEDDDDDDSA